MMTPLDKFFENITKAAQKEPKTKETAEACHLQDLDFLPLAMEMLGRLHSGAVRMNAINVPTLFLIWQFFIVHSCWKKVVDPTQKLSSLNIQNNQNIKDFIRLKRIVLSEKINFATTRGSESLIFQPDISQKVSLTRHNI